MATLDTILQPIADDMARYDALFAEAMQHSENALLDAALRHIAQRKGKRMRPVLVLLSARLHGQVNEAVLQAALALELLHTATLVHDDVADASDRRRGQKSVNALIGNEAAVLVGDYLVSKALQAATLTDSLDFVRSVSRMGQFLADGELLQIAVRDLETFEETSYYEVISKKTAALFATCAQSGALLGGGSADDAERMRQFGKLLGMCFQLRDDIFDFMRVDVGKPAGHDMTEGKLTLPVLYALRKTQDEKMKELALAVRRGEASAEDVATLVQFTTEQGGLEYAQWAMDEFRMMTAGLIREDGPADIAQALGEYVDFVAERLI